LRVLERLNYRTADHVIATNNSYRNVAVSRGGKSSSEVTVVRTGPDAERLHREAPDPLRKRGRRYLVAYLGVMGPQDGVDNVVRAAYEIVHRMGREDISLAHMNEVPSVVPGRQRREQPDSIDQKDQQGGSQD